MRSNVVVSWNRSALAPLGLKWGRNGHRNTALATVGHSRLAGKEFTAFSVVFGKLTMIYARLAAATNDHTDSRTSDIHVVNLSRTC
jgi:hypothetical protein